MKANLMKLNEKGGMAALLSVLCLSAIIIATLTSAYMFIENSAKYNSRIKSAYETAYAMEDLARNIRQVYDTTLNSGAMVIDANGVMTANPGNCPGNTTASSMTNGNQNMLLCVPITMLFADGFGCTSGSCFCVRNASAASNAGGGVDDRYCMNMPNWAANTSANSNTMVAKVSPKSSPKIQKWLARMDQALDTTIAKQKPKVQSSLYALLGYEIKKPMLLDLLIPEQALAQAKGEEEQGKTPDQESPGGYIGGGHIGGGKEDEGVDDDKIGGVVVTPPDTKPPGGVITTSGYIIPVGRCSTAIDEREGKDGQPPVPPTRDRLCEVCTGLNCITLRMPNVACKDTISVSQCNIATVNVKFE